MKNIAVSIIGLFLIWLLFLRDSSVSYGPGILAPDEPVQVKLKGEPGFKHEEYMITPLASFEIRARVLSKSNYRFDRGADVSPVDLALGWREMSDESILQHFDISQSGRWYTWRTDTLPIPRRAIQTNSANMHLIPGDHEIESTLDDVREGHLIELRGQLVQVVADDGWQWRSSLKRTDTGAGACELIFVESIEIVQP